jgi:orotate phosphoribosyltransferase-like protein
MDTDKQQKPHELDGPNWAVVNFDGVIETGVTYRRAVEVVRNLGDKADLAIVTAAAAERMEKEEVSSQ